MGQAQSLLVAITIHPTITIVYNQYIYKWLYFEKYPPCAKDKISQQNMRTALDLGVGSRHVTRSNFKRIREIYHQPTTTSHVSGAEWCEMDSTGFTWT
ncbi:hypothetical protein C0081_08165 [Cohaesibacter celericrescens]|uniref:Transposase n=1 Tax=Cohaesibacter celericrescens TaxID=2067669 RepID=A0A2N5XS09_9HYPH|nr:hypothetical protein C0081_08165 [Cohaesibacter celericrescens]